MFIHSPVIQPEAKFKTKIREGFQDVFLDDNPFHAALVASMLQKAGLPDQFFAWAANSVWIEAKVNGNHLKGAQVVVLPRMAKAGVRVAVVHTAMNIDKKDRIISVAWADPVTDEFHPKTFFKWADLTSRPFWNYLLGAA